MASRTKKALLNTSFELLLEIVTAVCSFVLPKLILSYYGSAYNGIISSISQFIGCVAILKSGIGSVTRSALYKPLESRDSSKISMIVNATGGFLRKVAIVFALGIVAFAGIYPFIVSSEFEYWFSFSLVVILSLSTFAQYYFGLSYQMVLEADQRNYLISILNIITTILNTVLSAGLIVCGFGIHVVKLISALIFLIQPVFFRLYVSHYYSINKHIASDNALIAQRWDAMGHQLASFINLNTDIIIATIFLGVKEVSVYTVYYMVVNAIKKAIKAISTGTTSAFGNMIARGEQKHLENRFAQYETLVFVLSTVLFTITAILIGPFIKIYTLGINDVNYDRVVFGYSVCLACFLESIRLPYQQIIYATGAFKKTKSIAYAEAAINISVSIVFVQIWGLVGIVVGTIIAMLFRTIMFQQYTTHHIIHQHKSVLITKVIAAVSCVVVSCILCRMLPLDRIATYTDWFFWAIIVSMIVCMICIVIYYCLFKNDIKAVGHSVMQIIRRKM